MTRGVQGASCGTAPRSRLRPLCSEGGTTLVEALVTVAVLGVAFVALLGGMATAIRASDVHRKQAMAEITLSNYVEAVQAAPYVSCPSAGPASYATATVTVPSGLAAPTILNTASNPFEYWASGLFQLTCAVTDGGAQRMWLQVSSTDGRVVESVQILKQQP